MLNLKRGKDLEKEVRSSESELKIFTEIISKSEKNILRLCSFRKSLNPLMKVDESREHQNYENSI